MLPKINRIAKKPEITAIFKNGRLFKNRNLNLRVLKNNLNLCRFIFIVSNKVAKKAVRRNKIKRWLREIVYKTLDKFNAGYDIMLVARPSIINQDFKDLNEELLASFSKMKILR